MAQPRHRYQVGPSTFTARQRPGGDRWWVHEVWWEATRHHDEEDFEEWHGPFASQDAAEADARGRRER